MKRKPDTLLPIELSILRAGVALRMGGAAEFHGYAVAKEISEGGEARRLTAHGTLYRALDRLEQRQLLESRLEDADLAADERRPRRRLYSVTALGERTVQLAVPDRTQSTTAATRRGVATP